MSNIGYIKKFRSQISKNLKRNHTSAYLVLDSLAENAKRDPNSGHPLLEIYEAIVTAEECGLTAQKFETAINFLAREGYIEIMHRGRKDQKSKINPRIKPESLPDFSRITSRINGTVLKLIDSECYDINVEDTPNQIPNQTRITSQKTPNKEEIRNKEIKEEEYIYNEKIFPISSFENSDEQISNEQVIPMAMAIGSSHQPQDPPKILAKPPTSLVSTSTSDNIKSISTASTSDNICSVSEYKPLKKSKEPRVSKKVENMKKSEVPEDDKLRFGEYIWFQKSNNSYEKLCQEFTELHGEIGKELVHHYIAKISSSKNPGKYVDFPSTIKSWRLNSIGFGELPKLIETLKLLKTNPKSIQSDNSVEALETRKQNYRDFVKENWKKFRPDMRPTDNSVFITVGNDKIYFNDPKFDELLKNSMRKALN